MSHLSSAAKGGGEELKFYAVAYGMIQNSSKMKMMREMVLSGLWSLLQIKPPGCG